MRSGKIKTMADNGSSLFAIHIVGLGLAATLLLTPTPAACSPSASRTRRSDDYDNSDNFLMGSNDYDNFFLKAAKSVPRIGRRSDDSVADGGDRVEQDNPAPVHVDRRSTDMNELVPSSSGGYDHFFLKASKSVPRIGKRNDEFFMKTAKSVPRIGRRGGDGPDNFLQQGKEESEYLRTANSHPGSRLRRAERSDLSRYLDHHIAQRSWLNSRLQVEESDPAIRSFPGGSDAAIGLGSIGNHHRIERRNFDELMSRSGSRSGQSEAHPHSQSQYQSPSRMAKRMRAALTEVGDWGPDAALPWFRQSERGPGPHKRSNPADLIDLASIPWESIDAFVRKHQGRGTGGLARDTLAAVEDSFPDVVLIDSRDTKDPADPRDTNGDKWGYYHSSSSSRARGQSAGSGATENNNNNSGAGSAFNPENTDRDKRSKELTEARFQPDVK